MGLIKLLRDGSWWVRSVQDPRWNGNGSGQVGAYTVPSEAQTHIDRCKETLGEPPADLEIGYMKD